MQTLLDPAILFFVFGLLAGCLRSNLEIPPPISRFLSLYLLMALGLKGGFALADSGFGSQVLISLTCAIMLAVLLPLASFALLRRWLTGYDAAAIAATYGSVSAVTFITAAQALDSQQIAYGGHMAAAMALMESPAIIIAVLFAHRLRQQGKDARAPISAPAARLPLHRVMHEAITDGAQMLLIGAMVIGFVSGETGRAAMQPFSGDLFKGMLAFFLLDMGLMAARSLPKIRGQSTWLISYAVAAPLVHAALALLLARVFAMPVGDGLLLMVLAASASYIAVPAALRLAIPEANPSLYLGLSLGVTFPLNILVGIPLYLGLAQRVLGP